MKELDYNLENELCQLRPAAPPRELAQAIGRELAAGAAHAPVGWTRRARWSLWASWTLTAAAAAVAAAAWWPAPVVSPRSLDPGATLPTEGSAVAAVVPVGSSNVLLDARDEGIVVLDDGRAARRVRLRYVDTVQLQDRSANSSIAVSRPREEVRFVPVNFY